MIKDHLTLIKNNKIILWAASLIFGLRMLQMGLGFAATYFLVRAISVEQYGQYNFVIGAVGLLSIFSLTEMNNAVMQSIARGFYGTYRIALLKSLLFSLIGVFTLWGLAAYYFFANQNSELAAALALSGVIFPFLKAMTQWKSLRMAEHRFKELTRIEGFNSALTSIAIIVSALFIPQNYLIPVLAFLAIPAIRNVFALSGDLKNIPKGSECENGSVEYGIKASLFSAIGQVAIHLDRVILFFFLPPTSVAMFSAADRLSDIFKSLTQDIAGAMGPKLAKQKSYTKKLDHFFLLFSWAMGACLVTFSFTFLPDVFLLIFSDKYIDAVPYAQALMCSVAIGNFAILRFRYIRSQLDLEGYKKVTIYAAIVRIISLMALVPFFHVWGAIASAFLFRLSTSYFVNRLIKEKHLIP